VRTDEFEVQDQLKLDHQGQLHRGDNHNQPRKQQPSKVGFHCLDFDIV
jgi:hypothetical protein